MHSLNMKNSLTYERATALLKYDPDTGIITRLTNRSRGDNIAGYTHYGEPSTIIDGFRYKASVLAYLLTTGNYPKGVMVHRNHLPHDNSWVNLQQLSMGQLETYYARRATTVSQLRDISYWVSSDSYMVKVGPNRLSCGTHKSLAKAKLYHNIGLIAHELPARQSEELLQPDITKELITLLDRFDVTDGKLCVGEMINLILVSSALTTTNHQLLHRLQLALPNSVGATHNETIALTRLMYKR